MNSFQNFLELASKEKVQEFEIRCNQIFAYNKDTTRWPWVLFQEFPHNLGIDGIFNLKLAQTTGKFIETATRTSIIFAVIEGEYIPLSNEDIKHFNNSFNFIKDAPDNMFGIHLEGDNLVSTNGKKLYTAKLINQTDLPCTIPITNVLKYFFNHATEISYYVVQNLIQFNFTWNNEKFNYTSCLNTESYPDWKKIVAKDKKRLVKNKKDWYYMCM